MRNLCSLLCACFVLVSIICSAQDNSQVLALKDVIDSLQQEHKLYISYETKILDDKEISLENIIAQDLPEATIKHILNRYNLELVQIAEKTYVIKRQAPRIQTVHINGTVRDSETKDILSGSSITIEGTSLGTYTNENGAFKISIPINSIVVISHIGYETLHYQANSDEHIDLLLIPNSHELDELVIVAYGEQNKSTLSGSISSVSKVDEIIQPASSIEQIIQGRTPGVDVIQNSGQPGSSINLRIRGVSSINAGNDPLYVVDGIPIGSGSLSIISEGAMNPNLISNITLNDIASIEVLKDAYAASLYGSRASNGVVLISTKNGVLNSKNITLNSYQGWQQVSKKIQMVSSAEYAQVINESLIHAQLEPKFSDFKNLPTTDWQDEIFRSAPMSNYSLSMSGGKDELRYYISANHLHQQGIIIGSDFKKYGARVNIESNKNNNFKYGIRSSYTSTRHQRIKGGSFGVLGSAMRKSPIFPSYNSDGEYFINDSLNSSLENPIALAKELQNNVRTNQLLSKLYFSYLLSKRLQLNTSLGINIISAKDFFLAKNNDYSWLGRNLNGVLKEAYSENISWISETTLNYDVSGDSYSLDFLMGVSLQEDNFSRLVGVSEDFPSESIYTINSGSRTQAFGDETGWSLLSYISRAQFTYKNRYIMGASLRADGSSRFSRSNRFGIFPSVSAGWRLGKERLLSDLLFVEEFKIRGSWGITGNQDIGDFNALGLMGGGFNYLGESGIAPTQLENPNLSWETTSQWNFGADISLFDNKINLTLDYYRKKTTGLLLQVPLPRTSGFRTSLQNVGNLENRGFEFSVGTTFIRTKNVVWQSDFSMSRNINEVTYLPNGDIIFGFYGYGSIISEGASLGSFYGYKITGFNDETGEYLYHNVGSENLDAEDRVILGSSLPKFIGGFSNTLRIKQFELNCLIQFKYGHDIFNGLRYYTESMTGFDNMTEDVRLRWVGPGNNAGLHKPQWAGADGRGFISDRVIEDGSFMRLKLLTVAYKVPFNKMINTGIQQIKIYASGENLYTLTKYKGFDPEVNDYQNDIQMGFDRSTYPKARTFLLGVQLQF